MTTPSTDQLRIVRDITGLMLATGGLTGLVVVAFVAHPLAGFALLSALAVGAGVWLATGRE